MSCRCAPLEHCYALRSADAGTLHTDCSTTCQGANWPVHKNDVATRRLLRWNIWLTVTWVGEQCRRNNAEQGRAEETALAAPLGDVFRLESSEQWAHEILPSTLGRVLSMAHLPPLARDDAIVVPVNLTFQPDAPDLRGRWRPVRGRIFSVPEYLEDLRGSQHTTEEREICRRMVSQCQDDINKFKATSTSTGHVAGWVSLFSSSTTSARSANALPGRTSRRSGSVRRARWGHSRLTGLRCGEVCWRSL